MVLAVNAAKTRLDAFQAHQVREARPKANPYERVGASVFINRAAVKMANMHAVLGEELLRTTRKNASKLTFVDVCAAPGGFTEYVYWRRNRPSPGRRLLPESSPAFMNAAQGWGMSLLDPKLPWKLNEFSSDAPHKNFGIRWGVDGTGDAYVAENRRAFVAEVRVPCLCAKFYAHSRIVSCGYLPRTGASRHVRGPGGGSGHGRRRILRQGR